MDLDLVFQAIGHSAWAPSAATTLVAGALSQLKLFIPGEKDITDRVKLLRQGLYAKVAKSYSFFFEGLINKDLDVVAGKPTKSKDEIALDHVTELVRVMGVLERVDSCRKTVKRCYAFLFSAIILGLIGFLLSFVDDALKPWVATVSYILILFEVILVFKLRAVEDRIGEYERTT
ncbi:MAG TPA: hypothetical protein VJB59_09935 [Bdellovibrionota bacterium]|nr:hypothetical protein [Bdellovibrionota bacterium]